MLENNSSTMTLLFLFFLLLSTGAGLLMTNVVKRKQSPSNESFHKVLEKAGKTVLRPGGSIATKRLQGWAGLGGKHSVIELSAGLGSSGMMLAQDFGCKVLLTDIDETRLEQAASVARRKGLEDQVGVLKLNMFDLTDLKKRKENFDCAVAEAVLTHYPADKKLEFFSSISSHVDQLLLQEMCLLNVDDDEMAQNKVCKDMQKVLKIGIFAEAPRKWFSLLHDAGFDIEQYETGKLAVLNPVQVMRDEGVMGFAKILWNVFTQPHLRSRILSVKRTIQKHNGTLGYMIIKAKKKRN